MHIKLFLRDLGKYIKKESIKQYARFRALKLHYQILIILLILVVLWMMSGCIVKSKHKSFTMQGTSAAPIYQTKLSESQLHSEYLKFHAITRAGRVVEIRAQTAGKVQKIVVNEGEALNKGDVILELEQREKKENVKKNLAALKRAKVSYDAEKALDAKGYSSKMRLENVKFIYESAASDYKKAVFDLEDSVIKAPFAGIVDTIPVEEGQYVGDPGDQTVVATMVDNNDLYVTAYIAERYINNLIEGNEVEVHYEGKIFPGKLTTVSKVADPVTRTFYVEAEVSNGKELGLASGVSVDLDISLRKLNAHELPMSALILDDAGDFRIKYLKDKTVQSAKVEVIDEENGQIWVSNLPAKVEVVIFGGQNLVDGTNVGELSPNTKETKK